MDISGSLSSSNSNSLNIRPLFAGYPFQGTYIQPPAPADATIKIFELLKPCWCNDSLEICLASPIRVNFSRHSIILHQPLNQTSLPLLLNCDFSILVNAKDPERINFIGRIFLNINDAAESQLLEQ